MGIAVGRRALRKVNPVLDLSRHLKSIDQLPRPWTPAALFGRDAPLEVEVGSGKGLFLRTTAPVRPESNFLGIEIVHKYAAFAAAGLLKAAATNALVVSGDALRIFGELIPDSSLAAVHVYFPDPWWKKRHRKRRVVNEVFLRNVQRALLPGGRFHLWTDVEEYFQASLELIAQTTRLSGPLPVAESPAEHDMDYRTHFERRVRQLGGPVYRAEYGKEE